MKRVFFIVTMAKESLSMERCVCVLGAKVKEDDYNFTLEREKEIGEEKDEREEENEEDCEEGGEGAGQCYILNRTIFLHFL